ncbi:MAG: peptidylprolyl isomerase [Myxococcota bacterium]|nr:peptidylprolyl isomerase [Myxococcota bacterium]
MRWLRSPLLHFLLLGAAGQLLMPEPLPALRIPEADLLALAEDWQRVAGVPPGPEQWGHIREQAIDEAVLFAEGAAAGLLEDDPVVLRRLAKVGAFVDPEQTAEDEAQAIAAARSLGLDRSDVIVRRYVTSMMRLAIEGTAPGQDPDDATLEAALRENAERYRLPERFDLVHVYVSGQREEPAARATRILAELAGQGPEAASRYGDGFPSSRELAGSRVEIGRVLGEEFGRALDAEAVGRWQGPVPSAYGLHLVYLRARSEARLPTVDEVRTRLTEDVRQERRAAHLRAQLRELRGRYAVELPEAG